MTKRKVQEKRSIPLRSPGESVNPQATRPSQLLFDEVKRLEDLEKEIVKFGHPKENNLDTQNINLLDTQINDNGNPKNKNLDTQAKVFGHPKNKNLGGLQPKNDIWTPKKSDDLGGLQPKNKNLDTQKSEKTKDYQKYEKARSTSSVHIRADMGIVKQIQHFLVENKKEIPTMKEFFEMSAMLFMNTFGHPENKNLGGLQPYDDRRLKMMFKTTPFIINLYLRYNSIFNEISAANGKGNWVARWSPRDDEAAQRYNEINLEIIELGIIQTQINKGIGQGKIQTFKYYTDEIEKVLASGVSDEMLKTILQYHRQVWKGQTKREVDLSFLQEIEQ